MSPTDATAPTEIDKARAASSACASTGEARINSRSERPNRVRVKSAIDWPTIQGKTSAAPLARIAVIRMTLSGPSSTPMSQPATGGGGGGGPQKEGRKQAPTPPQRQRAEHRR